MVAAGMLEMITLIAIAVAMVVAMVVAVTTTRSSRLRRKAASRTF